ncbi:MAG: hypothetical protein ABW215_21510 [Kibdelosporangium sp.]
MQVDGDEWTSPDSAGVHSGNDIAHAWTSRILEADGLDSAARLELALGLLDLLDEYAVTMEIWPLVSGTGEPELTRLFWDAYRRRLEAEEPAQAIEYSLWVDWFEDRATAPAAFAEVLGAEVLGAGAGAPERFAEGPLLRRARRVLPVSGPVPWPVKHETYQALVQVPQLHWALFRGILAGYHDVYGDLDPAAALAVLRQLHLPDDTEHLAALRAVLEAGNRNHHQAPDAWKQVKPS